MSKMKTKTVKIKHSQYHLERETAGEKAEVLPAEATESSEERRGVRAGLSLDFFLKFLNWSFPLYFCSRII